MLKPLNEYYISHKRQAAYIDILDNDPIQAARSIVKSALPFTYKVLRETFEGIESGEVTRILMTETVMDSTENFMWFATFFQELEKILYKDSYNIPYEKCPENKAIKSVPNILPPFQSIKLPKTEKVYIKQLTTNNKEQCPINNYRIKYIVAQYYIYEFQDDTFPSWYLLRNTNVFEQYNEKTNTRVKIDFMNGEFIYYIAGASDNWQRLSSVPKEIDHIISALLFRHYN